MTDELHPCCDPKSPSPIWEGTPTGKIIDINGIEAYISQPEARDSTVSLGQPSSSTKRIILLLTEGHGIYLPNAQLLADSFATELRIPVLMPDQFSGQARLPQNIAPNIPEGSKLVPWMEDKNDTNYENRGLAVPTEENVETPDAYSSAKPPWWREEGPEEFEAWKGRHKPAFTDPILKKVVEYIHSTYGDVKIGGVGYCFGGRYVMRLMGSGVIDVGAVNHPSFFSMEEVGRLGKGKRLTMFAAETDDILPPEKRRETEDVLTKAGATWMSTVFSGTGHGFSVRGDLTIKEVKLAKEKAFRGAVEWFRDWL